MFDDTVRTRYIDNVRIFAEKIDRALMLPFDMTLFKNMGHDGCRTLRSIQRTCAYLASEILESEKKPKFMSLEDYSRRPVFKSFKISAKNLGKIAKVLESSKETVDLVRNQESYELTYNCFKCVSAVSCRRKFLMMIMCLGLISYLCLPKVDLTQKNSTSKE